MRQGVAPRDRDISVACPAKAHQASRLEIAAKQGPHDLGMILDDVQSAVLDPV
jgi:hypothetical protein